MDIPEINIKEYELINGLKVLLIEDHSLPLISYCTFFKVGTLLEKRGITGISHFLEHMMFNGTEKYGPKVFDILLESNGGYSNASTSSDMTVYYEEFPREVLDLIIELESDRMVNLLFDPIILESERKVIQEERSSSIDNYPPGKLEEELFSLAYNDHPYAWPVIGLKEDIESISRDDLVNYYKNYYHPNNALIVIAGDISFDEVYLKIKKNYERIPPREINFKLKEVSLNKEEKRKKIYRKIEVPSFMCGYLCSEANNNDTFVLDILDTALAYGKSSRLYQRMVEEKEVAIKVSVDFSWKIAPSLFIFNVQMRTGHSNEDGEEIIYQELDKIRKESVSEEELKRAKNIQMVDFIRNFKKNITKANLIGQFESIFEDWRTAFSIIEKYQKITRDDIVEVTEKYFNDTNRTVVHLIPENLD